eukprot:gene10232-10302_t
MRAELFKEFRTLFNKDAGYAYFSPGRVNLIGEHIDYNGGWVMPCAIQLGTYLLVSPNDDGVLRFKSSNFQETLDIPVAQRYTKSEQGWFNYPLGIIDYFSKDGRPIKGLDMLFYGDIPISSGLSSSASIEVVTAFMLNELFDCGYSKLDLVKLSKSVENNFIGVNSGIMDQFAVAFGEKDKALMLNCDTLDYKAVESNLGDYVLAIINTNKPRKLAESKYNERVVECAAALKALKAELDINYLCDIDAATLQHYKHLIADKIIYNRARHVIEENDRVKLAAESLSRSELLSFGKLMYASHQSLRELYEVSGKELDTIVDYCVTDTDVAGARMTGAGFGGCAIALVKEVAMPRFSNDIIAYYTTQIGYAPSVYSSVIGNGVGQLAVLAAN